MPRESKNNRSNRRRNTGQGDFGRQSSRSHFLDSNRRDFGNDHRTPYSINDGLSLPIQPLLAHYHHRHHHDRQDRDNPHMLERKRRRRSSSSSNSTISRSATNHHRQKRQSRRERGGGRRRHRHRDDEHSEEQSSQDEKEEAMGKKGRKRNKPRQNRLRDESSSRNSYIRRNRSRSLSERTSSRSNHRRSNNHCRRKTRPDHDSLDASLSTTDSTDRRERRHRKRQKRHKRRGRRTRNENSSLSPVSPNHRHRFAAQARAGVVSDEDVLTKNQAVRENPHHPPNSQNENSYHGTSQHLPSSRSHKKRRGRSLSSHDDTSGHFNGRQGTIIADRYMIEREVGMGTFGRVVECIDRKSHSHSKNRRVAIKIVRDVKRYYESALIEAEIIEDVNRRGGRGLSHCAVMFDTFSFSGHFCMVMESLGPSLYDFQKRQNYRPFPLMVIHDFAKQLLETLEFFHNLRLIHTDLKPENILLLNHREVNYRGHIIPESTRIKVIDFGGATYDNEKKSSIVNTRQYRAPEVILGMGWSMPSDLWSIGCILAELHRGELLFATHDNVEHLALIEKVVGPFPRRVLKQSRNESLLKKSFDKTGAHRLESVLPTESLAYVRDVGRLESLSTESWFIRLLRRILVIDPNNRATARECLRNL